MSYSYYLKRFFHLTPKYDQSLIIRNIAYFSGSDAHVNHKLDIFLPFPKIVPSSSSSSVPVEEANNSRKQIPIIVHVHGGGWIRGSRTNEGRGGPVVGRICVREGFVGVVVSYRLARISLISFLAWSLIFGLIIIIIGLALLSWQLITGYVGFMLFAYGYNLLYRVRKPVNIEHMIDDICHALIYIRDHITEHCPDADPNQIYLSGHSAGAHLISLLILDKSYFQRHNLAFSSIRGVIVMSGIYSLKNPTHDSRNNIRNWIFRILYSSNLVYPKGKHIDQYSPIEFIQSNDELPPFLVLSAKFDMGLEIDAKRFVEKLKNTHYQVDYYVINSTHGTIASKFHKNDAQKYFFIFIRQHMRY